MAHDNYDGIFVYGSTASNNRAYHNSSAGVHAFFLTNASGSFGPFQFEEPLDLGGTRIVVHNIQGGVIEVRAGTPPLASPAFRERI